MSTYASDHWLQTLSPDILRIIFCYCLPRDLPSYIVTDHTTQMIRLSHVCRHWRDVALSTKELWSAFNLASDLGSDTAAKDLVLRRYLLNSVILQRSNPLPLDFRFYLGPWCNSERLEDVFYNADELVASLFSQESRWKNAEITILYEPRLDNLDLCLSRMRFIESLTIHWSTMVRNSFWSQYSRYFIIYLSSSMNLKDLRLKGTLTVVVETGIHFPNLTRCVLEASPCVSVDIFLNLMQAAPNIEDVTVSLNSDICDLPLPLHVSSSKLVRLIVLDDSEGQTYMEGTVGSIHDAKLRELCIRSDWRAINIGTDSFTRPGLCFSDLETLQVPLQDINQDVLLHLHRTSPKLLTIYLHSPSEVVIRSLTFREEEENMLTSLKHMHIIESINVELLETMVLSRTTNLKGSSGCLERVTLYLSSEIDIPDTISYYVESAPYLQNGILL